MPPFNDLPDPYGHSVPCKELLSLPVMAKELVMAVLVLLFRVAELPGALLPSGSQCQCQQLSVVAVENTADLLLRQCSETGQPVYPSM